MSRPIRVAFPFFGRGGWTGGVNYLRNTLSLIRSRLDDRFEALVFLTLGEAEAHGDALGPLASGGLVTDAAFGPAGRGIASLSRTLATGRERSVDAMVRHRKVDLVFENGAFFGRRLSAPVIAWMPDFQHRYLPPDMFERKNAMRRDTAFRLQVWGGRTLMVQSETGRRDLMRFHNAAPERIRIVRFAIDRPIDASLGRAEAVRAQYQLPARFFYLPNQFWRYKNHRVILDALALIAAERGLHDCPPVIMTGDPSHDRHPGFFDNLMADAAKAGVDSHLRHLGLIPFDHVLALNAACHAMINPSRFEGWSTPNEEAKTFGTPLLLSDLAIHREQVPDGAFFDPDDARGAADAMLAAADKPARRPTLAELQRAQEERLDAYASALADALTAAADPLA